MKILHLLGVVKVRKINRRLYIKISYFKKEWLEDAPYFKGYAESAAQCNVVLLGLAILMIEVVFEYKKEGTEKFTFSCLL